MYQAKTRQANIRWSAESWLLAFAIFLVCALLFELIDAYISYKVTSYIWILLAGGIVWFTRFSLNDASTHLSEWKWFLIPLVIALVLRVPWFGYREIQGDEGIVLVRAADVLLGDTVELLLHRKGPMEILLSMTTWDLFGSVNDVQVRAPFLLANLASLGMMYSLALRWFGRKEAILATSLLSIVGFHVAFSRVVQYQSLVMMWGLASVVMADRYRHSGSLFDMGMAALLLAAGLLSHYDAVLFGPALLVCLMCRWLIVKAVPWKQLVLTLTFGAGVLALFYIPFVLGPDFQNTLGYLLNERVGTESGGSLADVWQMATFYNSSWFIVGIAGFSTAGFAFLWSFPKNRMVKLAATLLFLIPFLFYIGIVSVPRTHIYTFFPGLCLIAAFGLVQIGELGRSQSNALYRLGQAGFLAWFFVCVSYVWLLFTWGPGEVQRNWETHRPNPVLYWTTWEEPPKFGLFGFPYQAGWRHISRTEATGMVYASNEEEEITNWYMGQLDRTHCASADLFLLAENVQDEVVFDQALLEKVEQVQIGQQLIAFADGLVEPQARQRRFRPEEIRKPTKFSGSQIGVALGPDVILEGFDLVSRGEVNEVVLYWQVNGYINRNYQAFVHVVDEDGNLLTQHDSAPECAINPTTRWEPGTIVRDPHPVVMPKGEKVSLMAGMYDLITQERLPVEGEPGNFVLLDEVVRE